MKELTSPIRVYWDVGPAAADDVIDYPRICEEIVAGKVLSLEVSSLSSTLSPACLTILDTLKDKAVALSVTLPGAALNDSVLELLRNLPLRVLFVATASGRELESITQIKNRTGGRPPVGVSFSVSRSNFSDLPDVLSFCITRGILYLALPMQRVMPESECFYLTRHEREALTAQLQQFAIPPQLKLIIHDPFLWRAFYPSVAFPEGGCQAANTMLYITPEADVYPCPTLPIKIGSLAGTSLREIIHSEPKKKVRAILAAAPGGCYDCSDVDQCKGGCRGRTYTMKNSMNEPDPACR